MDAEICLEIIAPDVVRGVGGIDEVGVAIGIGAGLLKTVGALDVGDPFIAKDAGAVESLEFNIVVIAWKAVSTARMLDYDHVLIVEQLTRLLWERL